MEKKIFTMVKAARELINHDNKLRYTIDCLSFDPKTRNSAELKFIKAASAQGTWNSDLLASTKEAAEFGAYVWAQTIPGRLYALANQLPIGTHHFNVMGSKAVWLGEGRAAPVVDVNILKDEPIKPYKIGSLMVTTRDLLRNSPELDSILQSSIVSAAVKAIDRQFFSDDAGDNVTPAGILRNQIGQPVSGSLATALSIHTKNGNQMNRSALICPVGYISTLSFGELAEIDRLGLPVIISEHADTVAIVNGALLNMNFGGTVVYESEVASVEMANPAGSTADQTPTASKQVSMYQTNNVAISGVTYCSWSMPKAQMNSVAPVTQVTV